MPSERRRDHLTLLERLDLALARAFALQEAIDLDDPDSLRADALQPDHGADSLWVARVLALRGFRVRRAEVARILGGGERDSPRTDSLRASSRRLLRRSRRSICHGPTRSDR